MNTLTKLTTAALAMALAVGASAAINVDGTLDAGYGSALSLQNIVTGFGKSTGAQISGGGSELDGGYATIEGGTLYLMLTGNLESNYNHLNVFIDTGAAGQNALSSTGDGLDGYTLPTGFNASQIFDANGDGHNLYVNQVSYDGTNWTNNYLGDAAGDWGTGANSLSGGTNPNGVIVSINNANADTLSGNAGDALPSGYAAGVTTGIEFGISLAALGNPVGNISIVAAINGGGNGYMSNQFLGSALVGTQNLGAGANLGTAGVTPFVVAQSVPEPSSLAALAVAGLALLVRRRKA